MIAGDRVRVVADTSYLRDREGVVTDEHEFVTGCCVLLDGEDESSFFSYKEIERI